MSHSHSSLGEKFPSKTLLYFLMTILHSWPLITWSQTHYKSHYKLKRPQAESMTRLWASIQWPVKTDTRTLRWCTKVMPCPTREESSSTIWYSTCFNKKCICTLQHAKVHLTAITINNASWTLSFKKYTQHLEIAKSSFPLNYDPFNLSWFL